MANEAITNATAWTLGSYGMLVHPATSTPDTTPPSAPTVSLNSRTSTTVVLNHDAPSDSDYSLTRVWALSLDGGSDVTTTGTGDTITVSGLAKAHHYAIVAVAEDDTGNRSTPDGFVVQTQGTGTPDVPLELYWYLNRQSDDHSLSPWSLDAELPLSSGKMESPRVQLHAGQVNELRVRLYCKGPARHIEVLGLGLTVDARPDVRPQGRTLS